LPKSWPRRNYDFCFLVLSGLDRERSAPLPGRLLKRGCAGESTSLKRGDRSLQPKIPQVSIIYMGYNAALSDLMPMLPKINTLPGAQCQIATNNWHRNAGCGECSLYMRRHVVRPFQRMGVQRVVFGHQPVQPALKIALGRGV